MLGSRSRVGHLDAGIKVMGRSPCAGIKVTGRSPCDGIKVTGVTDISSHDLQNIT